MLECPELNFGHLLKRFAEGCFFGKNNSPGKGNGKVAACTLLFGFGKLDAFPVDVWIRRVIEKYGFDPAALGDFAGLAQQYLFYAEREESK